MKRFLPIIALILAALTADAANYPYMILHQKDGTEYIFRSEGLRFTVSDGNLLVHSSAGEKSLLISDLATMEFSNDVSAIDNIFSSNDTCVEVYSPAGMMIGRYNSPEEMRDNIQSTGLYIIKNKKGTLKAIIKK